jgi:hypothetical protein
MFTQEEEIARNREKLGYEEFKQVILENLSKVITTQSHIDYNESFYTSVIFKMFEMYQNDIINPVSISNCVKMFDVFLYSMFKHQPETELPEDLV